MTSQSQSQHKVELYCGLMDLKGEVVYGVKQNKCQVLSLLFIGRVSTNMLTNVLHLYTKNSNIYPQITVRIKYDNVYRVGEVPAVEPDSIHESHCYYKQKVRVSCWSFGSCVTEGVGST